MNSPLKVTVDTVMWIRIRSDPHNFVLPDPDPDAPDSKISFKIMGNSLKNRSKSPEYHVLEIEITLLFNAHTRN